MVFKKHPILRYLIFYIVGILVYDLWNIKFHILGLFLTLIIALISLRKYTFLRHSIPVSFLFLGAIITWYNNDLNHSNHYSLFSRTEALLVEVKSYTEQTEKTNKVSLEVLGVLKDSSWHKSSGKLLAYFSKESESIPSYGDRYVLKAQYQEIQPPLSEYDFNYKSYLSRKNIFHQTFLRDGDFIKIGENKKGILYLANQANVYTHKVFGEYLTNPAELGVAEAMIAGMRSELDKETLDWYTKTGTVHALAVSGMHVAILFWVLNAFFGLFMNRKKLPFISVIIILLWTYALFTGFSASVCRSTLMFSLFQIGMYLQRNGNSVNTLFFSALFLLLFVPNWIYDVGFQLSYLAVLGILIFYPKIKKIFKSRYYPLQWLWDVTAVSIAAQIYTLPLVLYYFQQFPKYSLLANPIVSLLCIPMLPLGIMLLLFSWIPILNSFIAFLFKTSISWMNFAVYKVYSLPNSVIEGLAISELAVLLLFLIIITFQGYLNTKSIDYLKITTILVFGLVFLGSFKRIQQVKQNEILFHYIPKKTAVSFLSGRTVKMIGADSVINNSEILKYNYRGIFNAKGVNTLIKEEIKEDGNLLFEIGKARILWLKSISSFPNISATHVLVSNQALIEDIDSSKFTLIFDGTNSNRYLNKMKEKYKDAVFLAETGTKSIKLQKDE